MKLKGNATAHAQEASHSEAAHGLAKAKATTILKFLTIIF